MSSEARRPPATAEDITAVVRGEYARVVASLARRFGDLDIAEDATSEALLAAARLWPGDGLPPNPGGWLVTTAVNRAIDRLRRESSRDAKEAHAAMLTVTDPDPDPGAVTDDRLRLIFTCCHPALAFEARVALTLRLIAGLTMAEIAQAFLVPEATMAQRLTRAKRKIKQAGIPYRVPESEDLPGRLSAVLAVVYLIYNEGYLASSGAAPVREELCAEAIRLARLLRTLLPEEPEVDGLLALLLLLDARRPARFDASGALVTLADQDRSAWERDKITEGHRLVRECLRRQRPGQYQILAAINAVHTDSTTAAATDWRQVVALYDQLAAVNPGPVVALNRAVAVAELDGPQVALALVEPLALTAYHAWHVTRADLLRRLGRHEEAAAAYAAAAELTDNAAERDFLLKRRDRLDRG